MEFKFTNAYKPSGKAISDPWYEKTILRVYGSVLPFKRGQKVLIKSDKYSGVHEIGYIYKKVDMDKGGFWNLYFRDIKFKGDTSGTINTMPVQTTSNKDTPTETGTDENTIIGTGAKPTPGPVNRVRPEKTETMEEKVIEGAKSLWDNKWVKYLLIALGLVILVRILKK